MTDASRDPDLTRVETVRAHWYLQAVIAANPLTPEEHAHIERARNGDPTGLRVHHPDGTWTSLSSAAEPGVGNCQRVLLMIHLHAEGTA